MKKTLILATLAAAIASPAFAQQSRHHQAHVPQWSQPTARDAFGSATQPYRSQAATPRGDIIVGGENQGTDPDPLVRLQLQIDPPHGG
jgi:hypothetical protein